MKYMLLIYSDPDAYADPAAGQKVMGEYMAFTESIVESGEFVSGDPLQGTDTATCVRLRDGQLSTTDGPFVETKEVLGGYYVVDVKDLDRAIELASQIPDSRTGAIEVRPVMDIPG
ncbi:MAG: YciI family protein [Actinomycetota bacterium]|nr:YciI family protein [Actinomycetota bacterium]